MPSRRRVLLSLVGLSAGGAAAHLYRANHTIPPRDAGAEERFRVLQDRLLARLEVPARSTFHDLGDPPVRAHVIEAGRGQPVLFVHGGNSVAAGWIPLLAALHRDFRVLAPDRPGCGLTTKISYEGVDLRRHAVAFLDRIMSVLQLAQVAIVGNSMGGYFALAFALAHPDRVSRLILVGEPAGSAPRIGVPHRLIGTRVINSLLFATVLKPRAEAMRDRLQQRLVAHVDRVPGDLVECLAAGSLIPGATESWITMNESVYHPRGAGLFAGAASLTHALRPELVRLQPPTLLLWGEKDSFGPPALGHELARLMPSGRCDVVPDAGHLPWLDQLDLCADRVRAFLEG